MVATLKKWELFVPTPYKEPDGKTWSYGYGHTGHSTGEMVGEHTPPLKDEAEGHEILIRDLTEHYGPQLDTMLEAEGVDLGDYEWNAFLDILFNRGATRLRNSAAMWLLKQTDLKNYRKLACAAIVDSDRPGFEALNTAKDRVTGEVVWKLGLHARRIDDAALFLTKL
jgi:GH24 family phage-related lysozyme (muramidase)